MTDNEKSSPTHDNPSSPASPRQRAIDAYDSARDRAGEALGTARDRAGEALDTARDRAAEALDTAKVRTSDALNDSPLLALVGGIAAGAVIAALLPRSRAEDKLVEPTARRVKDSARAALSAARETGSEKLGALSLNREGSENTISSLVEGLTDLARSSANAAVDAVRTKR